MERDPIDRRGILEPGAEGRLFRLTLRDPHPDLAAHVEWHWIVRWDLRGRGPFEQVILPHPCVNLSSEPGLIAVYGIPLSHSNHRIEGAGIVVGTRFLPGGFAAFSTTPVGSLNDRIVDLAEPFGSAGRRLERKLAAVADDADAHIAAVEAHLRGRLPAPDPRYELVRSTVAEMLTQPAGTTVAQLAARRSVSSRTLQRAFNDYVGVSPKWVLKRYRIHEAAERIATGKGDDLAALALELGFFDQAHFTRDFSAQVGKPPAEYARACADATGPLELAGAV